MYVCEHNLRKQLHSKARWRVRRKEGERVRERVSGNMRTKVGEVEAREGGKTPNFVNFLSSYRLDGDLENSGAFINDRQKQAGLRN